MILFWRHILLVEWKCLILCQIIVICGKCWFSFFIRKSGDWSASRAPKSLPRCCSKWNNVPWLVLSHQRRWFRCWRPSAWRKAKNLRRRWFYLLWGAETERNHYWGTILNALDAFEPSTARKRPQYDQRHEKVTLQHDNARPHVAKPVQTYLETLK